MEPHTSSSRLSLSGLRQCFDKPGNRCGLWLSAVLNNLCCDLYFTLHLMCVNMSLPEAPPPEPHADLCPELSRCATGGRQQPEEKDHQHPHSCRGSSVFMSLFGNIYKVLWRRDSRVTHDVCGKLSCGSTEPVWSHKGSVKLLIYCFKGPIKTKCNQVKQEETFCQICLDKSSVCWLAEHSAPGHILPAFFKRCGGVFRPVFKHVNKERTMTRPGGLAGGRGLSGTPAQNTGRWHKAWSEHGSALLHLDDDTNTPIVALHPKRLSPALR